MNRQDIFWWKPRKFSDSENTSCNDSAGDRKRPFFSLPANAENHQLGKSKKICQGFFT